MSYIAVTLNHFRAIQEWTGARQAEAHLDMKSFELEVQWQQGRCLLRPQFLCSVNGNLSYTATLGPEASAFIGWLPYRPVRWSMSSDKREFKRFVLGRSLHTPLSWPTTETAERDHVLKRPMGSFGTAVSGPYRAQSARPRMPEVASRDLSALFAEEFILGRNLRVWYWGGAAFHVHLHAYPRVRGDGVTPLEALIARRLGREDSTLPHDAERPWILSSLAYQGWSLFSVLPPDQEAWIDYRYGRLYAPPSAQAHSDSVLSHLAPDVQRQVRVIGSALHAELLGQFGLQMLFAVGLREGADAPVVGVVVVQQALAVVGANSADVDAAAFEPIVEVLQHEVAVGDVDEGLLAVTPLHGRARRTSLTQHGGRRCTQPQAMAADDCCHFLKLP